MSREKEQNVTNFWKYFMVDGIKERFAIIREQSGLNVKEFAASLGMEGTTVSSIESGKREPSKEVLYNLAVKYSINLNWIFTGIGEKNIKKSQQALEKPSENRHIVPLLRQKVSCGPGVNWEDEQNIADYIDIFDMIPRLKIKRLFALCVAGNSMIGAGIRDGDYVLFDGGYDQESRDGIYVFALDGEVYCKLLEFDMTKIKIFSVRFVDLDKSELMVTLDAKDMATADRFTIFGRVLYWLHPNQIDINGGLL
ncbi:MAG: XRE family transcriptional regulator [Spirochaetaceae bacterium]|nr:XRE family transcriptional regulator [Spirochaetaceae bacterium]